MLSKFTEIYNMLHSVSIFNRRDAFEHRNIYSNIYIYV
jgi:hypothetical protein